MSELSGPSRLDITETDGQIVAATPALRVTITREPFSLAIERTDGSAIISPPAPPANLPAGGGEHGAHASFDPDVRYLGFTYGSDGMRLGSYNGSGRDPRWYTLTAVTGWERVGDALHVSANTDDVVGRQAQVTVEFLDDLVVRVRLTLDRDAGITEMGAAFATASGEGFFGLGERFARGNHRGHEVLNWIEDSCFDPRPGHDWTYWPVPYFLSSRGYGILLATTRRAVFRLGSDRDDAWQASVDGAALDLVCFGGPTPMDVIRQYTALTGRPPLPQPWAFGVWKTALSGSEAVLAEAQRLRDEDLGVSALWVYDQLELETNSGWLQGAGLSQYPVHRRPPAHR